MIEEARRAVAHTPVRWDEVRERRVLGAIERRLQERPVAGRPRSRRRLALTTAAVAAAALLSLTIGWQWSSGSASDRLEPRLAFAELDSSWLLASRDRAATMAFADGSIAHLFQDARVDVNVQTQDLVRLEQPAGKVRYEVAPDPGRRFVVDARGVHVRVIGTVFTVDVEADAVMVRVERGRVAVESQDRVAELGVGDELRVERRPRHPRDNDMAIESEEGVVAHDILPSAPSDARRSENRSAPKAPTVSVEVLLERADQARVQGRLDEAASALSELVRRHPKDPRAYSAHFSLGKVERIRGHHAAAASAFAACYERAPAGSLSEDARAEAAVSWLDAGQRQRALEAAQAYLARHPEGAHAARMQRILQRAQ